eukprot:TRINITY_DN82309_c0_g1_i1.p1 TRINITY_DN82309_c0_g1~~TRINITY_DN82309_c0_g1_i1.p1  ORF type:complete len:305 (-),score=91.95 TRINITY_DN82309_c0_g1_i1:152-1066(-)
MSTEHVDEKPFLCCCCAVIRQSTSGLLEKWGKFVKVLKPGMTIFNPCSSRIAGTVSHRVRQVLVSTDSKTKDNVTVSVRVALQYYIMDTEVEKAFYRLSEPHKQMEAYIDDVVRSFVPRMTLDALFESKDDLSLQCKEHIEKEMDSFGFRILRTLVTDIRPDARVQSAMNEINAAQRLRVAAVDKAEARKIELVKNAEAEAESMRLHGVGISQQRMAILKGYEDSVGHFATSLHVSPMEAMLMTLATQYFDMLKEVGTHGRNSTIFVPQSAGGAGAIVDALRTAIMEGSAGMMAASAPPPPPHQ